MIFSKVSAFQHRYNNRTLRTVFLKENKYLYWGYRLELQLVKDEKQGYNCTFDVYISGEYRTDKKTVKTQGSLPAWFADDKTAVRNMCTMLCLCGLPKVVKNELKKFERTYGQPVTTQTTLF